VDFAPAILIIELEKIDYNLRFSFFATTEQPTQQINAVGFGSFSCRQASYYVTSQSARQTFRQPSLF
jgi:hypothetical protein